ncbi:ParB N-terminal domain-containing protein [Thermobifida halotolerans]|uniref:ParB N-terminal domain-containing protein n=1 Tax=Thermobifida halotolerans TaxID=483545 RepID=A0AA97M1K0_9ACTN|nr:ParB N-terminal domain-containing protein [Thermobifida halotolerans]
MGVAALPRSSRLRRRRYDAIPLRGPGSAATGLQGREPGEATAPAELADLISSIATVGVLQPVLAEEITSPHGPPALHLVAGERRLRACRWGAVNLPDNPHFASLPAIICPGPLSPEERRVWQIVENLAREPLQPGEQAAALLLHRCAVLTGKLLRAGRPIPAETDAIEDPVARWEALERIRGQDVDCAAPWSEVLHRLGLQLSPRKARELVAAFRALPRHICEEMDEAKIRLHTRIRFARLLAGRAEAAEQIWAAVKARKQPHLLAAAVQAGLDNPGLCADEALDRAEAAHDEANQSRTAKLSREEAGRPSELVHAMRSSGDTTSDQRSRNEDRPSSVYAPVPGGESAAPEYVEADEAVEALRRLVARLRAGRRLDRYAAGSLRLLLEELRPLLEEGANT